MITGYFGVPGCGKTSLLTKFAIDELKRLNKGKSKYKHICSNFPIKGIDLIKTSDLAYYNFTDSLILLDELTLDIDARNYKSLDKGFKDFIILHRHGNNDIVYAVQDPSSVDKRVRDLTFDLFYISRSNFPILRNRVRSKRIFRNLNINEHTSELTLGYRFSKFFEGIVTKANRRYKIKKYWQYFDSFDLAALSDRPYFFIAGDTDD